MAQERADPAPPTPAARGFRLPAEWEPQESVWLVWPRDTTTWPDGRIEGARVAYLEAMAHITRNQRVDLIVHPDLEGDARAAVGRALPPAGHDRIRWHVMPHVDSWIRDYGPVYLLDGAGRRLALDWRFNAWGEKYESLRADDDVVSRLGPGAVGAPVERVPYVLEGGSIESDGQGTILTTRECLLDPFRNPHLDATAIETLLCDQLGARKVLWLGRGIRGDDTDGHIDTITRFVAPGTVVTAWTDDPDHPDHEALRENRDALRQMTDAAGRPMRVIDLPVPDPLTTEDGQPLPAGHANFLITNGCVLVPVFGCASDKAAVAVMASLFPEREVVPLDSSDLVWGMGVIHCLSMQMPAPLPAGPAATGPPV